MTEGKVAFCFPGQGSQEVGMGRAMSEAFPAARDVYERAAEATGLDIAALCFEGPIERRMSHPVFSGVRAAREFCRYVYVAVDETRQHGCLREVDDVGARGCGESCIDAHDLLVAHED